jgi:hypothetical protein
MNLKRLIGSVAVAGVVGASTLGIGAGVANADAGQSHSGTAEVQPTDWHGYGGGFGHGRGHDYGGYDYGYRGGWPVDRWWHPWGVPWHW